MFSAPPCKSPPTGLDGPTCLPVAKLGRRGTLSLIVFGAGRGAIHYPSGARWRGLVRESQGTKVRMPQDSRSCPGRGILNPPRSSCQAARLEMRQEVCRGPVDPVLQAEGRHDQGDSSDVRDPDAPHVRRGVRGRRHRVDADWLSRLEADLHVPEVGAVSDP